MIEVINIDTRDRWKGLVIPLTTYEKLIDMSFVMDDDEREDFWFEVYENQGITFDPNKHVIVEY